MEWTGQFVRWIDEPGWSLPSDSTGSPEPTPFTATWQGTERPTMKKTAILQLAISLVALAALALSLATYFKPEPTHSELEFAIIHHGANLEGIFRLSDPEYTTGLEGLRSDISYYTRWEREWNAHAQALHHYGALTGSHYVGFSPIDTESPANQGRKSKLQLLEVATNAIKPPKPNSKIVLTTDEIVKLVNLLNEVGWAKDVNLAELLEERAKHEETANPDDARKLRAIRERIETNELTR